MNAGDTIIQMHGYRISSKENYIIYAQRHIADICLGGDGSTALIWSVTMSLEFDIVLGVPSLESIQSIPYIIETFYLACE